MPAVNINHLPAVTFIMMLTIVLLTCRDSDAVRAADITLFIFHNDPTFNVRQPVYFRLLFALLLNIPRYSSR